MIPTGLMLEKIWLATATHLWQTTIVVLPLFLLARVLRNAPARLSNLLWTLGLVKLLVPLALLEPVARRIVLPVLERIMPSVFIGPAWLNKASAVLDPGILIATGAPTGWSVGNVLLIGLTVAWGVGAGLITLRSVRLDRRYRLASSGVTVARQRVMYGRLRRAVAGTCIPPDVVRVVSGSAMPAVRGILKPQIVIPELMIRRLSLAQLRAVLLHEDAHRRRLDPVRALLDRAALSLFYFYPLIWSLLRRLHDSCEMACDEAAMRAGIHPEIYARALARTLRLGLLSSGSALASPCGSSSGLRRRFLHIEHSGRYVTMRRHHLAIVTAIVLMTAVSLIPIPHMAGTEDSKDMIPPVPPKADPAKEDLQASPSPPGAEDDLVTPPKMIPKAVVRPEYPEAARKAGIGGEVVLNVEVKADGTVGSVSVRQGIPEAPELELSAEEAVRQWRFVPATKDGRPIDVTIAVPIAFSLDDKHKVPEGVVMPAMIPESVVNPVYPEDARKAGVSGKVVLTVTVEADGTPSAIEVAEEIEGYPSMAESAVSAVMQWRFTPATKDGKAFTTTVKIPVMFRLEEDKETKPADDD
jgi:TonB family protein